jgi:hypothetical protein
VLEGRVQPAVGLVGDRAGSEPGDLGGGRGVVGHDQDRADDRAGERRGDGVGQQRQDEGVVRLRIPGRQRPEAGLGHRQPLRRDHHRPRLHRPM